MAVAASLLPVELRHANHTASTNPLILRRPPGQLPTIEGSMASMPLQDQIAERVERLLLRHEQLRHTNELLAQQVAELTQERDSLRSRLQAARHRIDALVDRLPTSQPPKDGA